jgi:AMMECR1 domain-containing protein
VILQDGPRRATFLPQVWQQLPSKEELLSHLCAKMGASPTLWKTKMLDVQTYQVEEFSEKE